MSIRTYFDRAVARDPAHPAVQVRVGDQVVSRSYGAMAERVAATAELAGRLDLVPGRDPVALILENSPEWMEIYLAHAGCGITVVPIDPKLRPSEVAYILKDSGAAAVYTDRRHIPLLQEILPELPALRQIVLLDGHRIRLCALRSLCVLADVLFEVLSHRVLTPIYICGTGQTVAGRRRIAGAGLEPATSGA